MPLHPSVEPLTRSHRRLVFYVFLLVFAISMPSLWFYTTGYRFDWNGDEQNIVSVGGLYITTDSQDVDFYVDEVQVTNFRIFRQASYIQNLTEGVHPVHVQGEGLQTWTKDLPVNSYIVTEAFAFTMPLVPHIRMIGEYTTATGTNVFRVSSSSPELPFTFASTTNPILATTSRATTTLIANSEYEFVTSLFAPAATSTTIIDRISGRVERQFGVVPATTTATTTLSTSTKEWQNVRLFKDSAGDIEATWLGSDREQPHYYCIADVDASTTPKRFGTHVYADMVSETIDRTLASNTKEADMLLSGQRICREDIRIDRKGKEVLWFDFFPESTDLVLMLLPEGLYVVEIDDRAWQNTQLLYPGNDLKVALNSGRIYVKDREQYLEVFTKIAR